MRFIVSSMMDFIMVRCGCYIMILTGVQPVFGCIQQQRPRQPHWRLPFLLFIFARSRSLCHSLSRFVPSLASPAPSMAPRRLPKGKSGLRRLPNPQTGSRRLPKPQTGPKDTVKNPKLARKGCHNPRMQSGTPKNPLNAIKIHWMFRRPHTWQCFIKFEH